MKESFYSKDTANIKKMGCRPGNEAIKDLASYMSYRGLSS